MKKKTAQKKKTTTRNLEAQLEEFNSKGVVTRNGKTLEEIRGAVKEDKKTVTLPGPSIDLTVEIIETNIQSLVCQIVRISQYIAALQVEMSALPEDSSEYESAFKEVRESRREILRFQQLVYDNVGNLVSILEDVLGFQLEKRFPVRERININSDPYIGC